VSGYTCRFVDFRSVDYRWIVCAPISCQQSGHSPWDFCNDLVQLYLYQSEADYPICRTASITLRSYSTYYGMAFGRRFRTQLSDPVSRLILIWITALLVSVAIGNLFGLLRADAVRIGLMMATLLFVGVLLRYGRCEPGPTASGKMFIKLNLFITLWFGCIVIYRYAVESNQFVIQILSFFG